MNIDANIFYNNESLDQDQVTRLYFSTIIIPLMYIKKIYIFKEQMQFNLQRLKLVSQTLIDSHDDLATKVKKAYKINFNRSEILGPWYTQRCVKHRFI